MHETYNSIFTVTEEGQLKAYRSPAGYGNQNLGCWFNGPFGCKIFETDTSNYVMMHRGGVLLCVEVADHDLDEEEEDQ